MALHDVLILRTARAKGLTDDELMGRIRRGDPPAFRQIYDRYKDQLFVYCLRMMGDRDAALDVLQEVFLRIHTRSGSYRDGTNVAGWVHTIARNLCLNARRDAGDRLSYDDEEAYAGTETPATDVGLQQQLADAIARLPEIYREALVLREYEELSYREICEVMELNLTTVKFRIFKAREMLRERLRPRLDSYRVSDPRKER